MDFISAFVQVVSEKLLFVFTQYGCIGSVIKMKT